MIDGVPGFRIGNLSRHFDNQKPPIDETRNRPGGVPAATTRMDTNQDD
jgi:hypothetical protein